MKGYKITYKPKDDYSRTKINHELFGRNVYRDYRGRKYAYYVPGVLHDVNFARLESSRIFIKEEDIEKIDEFFESLSTYADLSIEECERNKEHLNFKTGEQHWTHKAKERGLPIRKGRN